MAEYACPVFHNALPAYMYLSLEKLQKRAVRIIFPFVPYKVALATAGLPSMYDRRETITAKLFNVVYLKPQSQAAQPPPNKKPVQILLKK